jgi:prepilin-type processing-associated H-X9-DG protein
MSMEKLIQKKVQGFTMVELLVTIGIMIVLAGFIFAGFGKVKESGERTQCMVNLKQVGVAANLFAADNDGSLPYTYGLILGVNNDYAPGLIDLLGSYVNNDYRVFYCTDVEHCLPPPALAKENTYEGQMADNFSVTGYNWLCSQSWLWTAPLQKSAGSGNRILATCFSYGGGVVHKREHNMLFADGHVQQRKTAPNGLLTGYIDPSTLLWDESEGPL